MDAETRTRTAPKQESLLLNLACNILLPALILSKFSTEERLGPLGALMAGLAFPFCYGAYDLVTRKKWNFFSIVGIISVSLTGGLGLMKAEGFWFAVKEASIPLMFATAVLLSLVFKKPFVRMILLNESIIDVPKLDAALAEHGSRAEFDTLLRRATWWLAGSLSLSAVLNFILARIVLKSTPGTPEFTAELGRMTWLAWPVIALPSLVILALILWRLFAGVQRLTGLTLEDLAHKKAEK